MFGSHKATVTVLTVLGEIQAYANIDPDVIESIKRWVQLRQEDDGRFTPLQADQPIERFVRPVRNVGGSPFVVGL